MIDRLNDFFLFFLKKTFEIFFKNGISTEKNHREREKASKSINLFMLHKIVQPNKANELCLFHKTNPLQITSINDREHTITK